MRDSSEPIDETALVALVDRYQHLVAGLADARTSDEHELARDNLRQLLEELWPLLASLVRPVAWTWVRRHLADLGGSRGLQDALEGVATSMCMHILDTLATRPVAPRPPLGPLLRRIASNRMIDDLRYSRRHSPDQPALSESPASPAPPPTPAPPLSLDQAARANHPVFSLDIAVELDNRLYREECLAAIGLYWQLRLSADERRIVDARLKDPPLPYDAIAALFSPPWTAQAVRKRYSRIIADTRAHLQAIDLIPSSQD